MDILMSDFSIKFNFKENLTFHSSFFYKSQNEVCFHLGVKNQEIQTYLSEPWYVKPTGKHRKITWAQKEGLVPYCGGQNENVQFKTTFPRSVIKPNFKKLASPDEQLKTVIFYISFRNIISKEFHELGPE